MTEELITVPGYIKTEADCPHCGKNSLYEGDCSNTVVTCKNCGEKLEIGNMK